MQNYGRKLYLLILKGLKELNVYATLEYVAYSCNIAAICIPGVNI